MFTPVVGVREAVFFEVFKVYAFASGLLEVGDGGPLQSCVR